MLGALGVAADPGAAAGLSDCELDVSTPEQARVARYALSTSQTGDPMTVIFLPLGVSRLFATREDVAASAASAGVRLLAVDRPGVGGTSPATARSAAARSSGGGPEAVEPAPRETEGEETVVVREKLQRASGSFDEGDGAWWKYSRTVRRRLWTHSRDVAAVLEALGVDGVKGPKARVVGICAGSPYALHFVRAFPDLVDARHLTLVTPWVSPECPSTWGLARLASNRWFFGRSFVGSLLGSLQLGVTIPLLRSLEPAEALELLEKKLTDEERAEVRVARRTARLLAERRASGDGSAFPWLLEDGTPTTADEEEASSRDDEALGAKALDHLRVNGDAHNVAALRDDVRVCLSSLEEIDVKPEDLKVASATVFAADRDELVLPDAAKWLADRLPNSELVIFQNASHAGVQTLRRNEWLRAAANDGEWRPRDHEG